MLKGPNPDQAHSAVGRGSCFPHTQVLTLFPLPPMPLSALEKVGVEK